MLPYMGKGFLLLQLWFSSVMVKDPKMGVNILDYLSGSGIIKKGPYKTEVEDQSVVGDVMMEAGGGSDVRKEDKVASRD